MRRRFSCRPRRRVQDALGFHCGCFAFGDELVEFDIRRRQLGQQRIELLSERGIFMSAESVLMRLLTQQYRGAFPSSMR